jgi:hypothetical protein
VWLLPRVRPTKVLRKTKSAILNAPLRSPRPSRRLRRAIQTPAAESVQRMIKTTVRMRFVPALVPPGSSRSGFVHGPVSSK